MDNLPGLYNSLFYVIGKCYNWNLDKIADLYGTSSFIVELWLREMNFSDEAIFYLKHREDFESEYCTYCGILSKEEYCSEDCKQGHIKQQYEISRMIITRHIPIIGWKNIYWDIEKGKIIRENCIR